MEITLNFYKTHKPCFVETVMWSNLEVLQELVNDASDINMVEHQERSSPVSTPYFAEWV